MASFQLSKSTLMSPFSSSQSNFDRKLSCFRSDQFDSTIIGRTKLRFQTKHRSLRTLIHTRNSTIVCRIQDSENRSGEEPPESLFMKELKRRGMTPTSLLEETNRSIKEEDDQETEYRERDGGVSSRNAVSTDGRNLFNQREQSMLLNSEGLEGLIPRGKLLLTLGGTFFLAFWQLILLSVAAFSTLYLYFGPSFIHDASNRPITPPEYIDPYVLLEEERIRRAAPHIN